MFLFVQVCTFEEIPFLYWSFSLTHKFFLAIILAEMELSSAYSQTVTTPKLIITGFVVGISAMATLSFAPS